MTTKEKYELIDKTKVSAKVLEILEKMEKASSNFTNAEVNSRVDTALDKIIEGLKVSKPEALLSVSDAKKEVKKEKKEAEEKNKGKDLSKKKDTDDKTGLPKKDTVEERKDIIKKESESEKEARERAKKELEKENEKAKDVIESQLEKLNRIILEDPALRGFNTGTSATGGGKSTPLIDAERKAIPRGRRVSQKGRKNQHGTSEGGRVYWENRENRSDRKSPDYPTGKPYLAKGGMTENKTDVIKLYYHETSGGAEYLCSSKVKGSKDEGSFDSEYVVRIDGATDFGGELRIRKGGDIKRIILYYHKTNGGAEYLCSSKVKGSKGEGSFDSEFVVRIDGATDFGGELRISNMSGNKLAKGGNVYASDDLYEVKMVQDGIELDSKLIRARNKGEARMIFEDMYQEKYQDEFGAFDLEIDIAKDRMANGGRVNTIELEREIKETENKYPKAKVSYFFAKDSTGKGYVIRAKEGSKIVYSSYKPKYGGMMADGGKTEQLYSSIKRDRLRALEDEISTLNLMLKKLENENNEESYQESQNLREYKTILEVKKLNLEDIGYDKGGMMADGGKVDKRILEKVYESYDIYKDGTNREHYYDFDNIEKVKEHIEKRTGMEVLKIKEIEIGRNYPDNMSHPYYHDDYEFELVKGQPLRVERMYGRPNYSGNVAYTNMIEVKNLWQMADGGGVGEIEVGDKVIITTKTLGKQYEGMLGEITPTKLLNNKFSIKLENGLTMAFDKGEFRHNSVNPKYAKGGMMADGVDYVELINLIKSADNPRNLPIYYNSDSNVVNIGGVGYDKAELVKMFNARAGQSLEIKNLFYQANQYPQETKNRIESMNVGIEVEIGKGYGNETFVKYIKMSKGGMMADGGYIESGEKLYEIANNMSDKEFQEAYRNLSEKEKDLYDTLLRLGDEDKIALVTVLNESKKPKYDKSTWDLHRYAKGGLVEEIKMFDKYNYPIPKTKGDKVRAIFEHFKKKGYSTEEINTALSEINYAKGGETDDDDTEDERLSMGESVYFEVFNDDGKDGIIVFRNDGSNIIEALISGDIRRFTPKRYMSYLTKKDLQRYLNRDFNYVEEVDEEYVQNILLQEEKNKPSDIMVVKYPYPEVATTPDTLTIIKDGERVFDYEPITEDFTVVSRGLTYPDQIELRDFLEDSKSVSESQYTPELIKVIEVIKENEDINEIVDELKSKGLIKNYIDLEKGREMADGGEIDFSERMAKMRSAYENLQMSVKGKIASAIGIDEAVAIMDTDYSIHPFNLIFGAVRGGLLELDEINKDLVNEAVDEAERVTDDYRDSGQGIGGSDMTYFTQNVLNNAGYKTGFINNTLKRVDADGNELVIDKYEMKF